MKDPATIVAIIRTVFEGLANLGTLIVVAYAVRSLFDYLKARLTVIGAEPVIVTRRAEAPDVHSVSLSH